jgi:hypothetical protein
MNCFVRKNDQGKEEPVKEAQIKTPVQEAPKEDVYVLPDIIETGFTGRYTITDLFDIMITEEISDLHILPNILRISTLW